MVAPAWLVISAEGEIAARRDSREAAIAAADERWPAGLAIARHEPIGEQWERRDGAWTMTAADDGRCWQSLGPRNRETGRHPTRRAAMAFDGAIGARDLRTGETWRRLLATERWVCTISAGDAAAARAGTMETVT